MARKRWLDTVLDTLLGPPHPIRNGSLVRHQPKTLQRYHHPRPPQKGRWRRSGPQRFHWHVTPHRRQYFFKWLADNNGAYDWRCPFCKCR